LVFFSWIRLAAKGSHRAQLMQESNSRFFFLGCSGFVFDSPIFWNIGYA
jgi:hypothetical protein